MTMGQGFSRENVKQHGEVFTPPMMTFKMMLLPEVRDVLTDLRNAPLDPCVGQGQFPATQLVLRMLYNLDRLGFHEEAERARAAAKPDKKKKPPKDSRQLTLF